MNVMLFFFFIFAVVSIFHITFIFHGKRTLRRVSKICIIPPLIAAYIAGAGTRFLFPLPALVLGWFGDILLIRKEKKLFFLLGLIAFLFGHLCYIITFLECLGFFGYGGGSVSITALAISVPPAIVFGLIVFRVVRPTKEMAIPVIVYMIALESVALLGLQVLIFNLNFAAALIFFGCLFFIVSDMILAYYTFRRVKRFGAILIMIFYTLAQAGIVLGLISL